VKSSKLASILASASFLFVAACGGDGGSARDAKFVGADAGHMSRAFTAAAGLDAAEALFIGVAFVGAPASTTACPQIAHDGNRTTVKGGCTTAKGDKIEGSATFENVPNLTGGGYDATKPTKLEFDSYSVNADKTKADGVIIDGSVTITKTSLVTELGVTTAGIESHSAIELDQNGDGTMTAKGGSSVEIDKLGSADVSGTWKLGKNGGGSGKITLTGKDTLVFDIGAVDASGCYPYSINGTASGKECSAASSSLTSSLTSSLR